MPTVSSTASNSWIAVVIIIVFILGMILIPRILARSLNHLLPKRGQSIVLGVVLAVVAIMPSFSGVQCSNGICINYVYTFYGLDEHTFKVLCGIVAVLCIAGGIFFIVRHRQTQAQGSIISSGSQKNLSDVHHQQHSSGQDYGDNK